MFKSPLSPEEIQEIGRIFFEGGSIPQADWEKLSDADKVAVNDEAERLEEEAEENPEPPVPDEETPTPKI